MREHLQALLLPQSAVDWLCMLYEAEQTLDDYADGDKVSRAQLDTLIWNTLVAMPSNAFFQEHRAVLLPVLGNSVLQWQASDAVERAAKANEVSFVWRASFFQVVLSACQCFHGPEWVVKNGAALIGLYGENYTAYLEEMKCRVFQ